MKLNKKLVTAFASASALALTCGVATELVQPQTVNAAYSNINNQVKQYGFGRPNISYRNSTFTDDFAFNNGAPEGIVVHETATPGATAENEATYFLREWSNMYAYVHAFVDHTGVIQIHPTNRGVWGAGPIANGRFIQVELCQESSPYNFALSVNNDAYYIAGLLKQYGMKPDLAEHDGVGTIWSHSAVSNHLGGTDHSDPTGYFAKWGYSMDQFYDLIVEKYNELMGNGGTVQPPKPQQPVGPDYSLMGKTTSAGSPIAQVLYRGNIAVWSNPGKKVNGQYLPSTSSWKVNGKAVVNGKTWYRIGVNQWIDGQYLYVKGTASIPNVNVAPPVQPPVEQNKMGQTTNEGNPVARVDYKAQIAVFKEPGKTATGQYVNPKSSWKVAGKATALGRTWYRVGTNQWLDGQYLYVTGASKIPVVNTESTTPSTPSGQVKLPAGTVGRVNYIPGYGIRIWAKPGASALDKYLPHGTAWKVFAKTTLNGRTWYNLGGNQWIDGQYLNF